MFGRADFERFFTVGRLVIIALIVLLIAGISIAKAEDVQSPTVLIPFPLVCSDRDTLVKKIELGGGYAIWHGVRNSTFLTTLYLYTGGRWIMTEERAMSKIMCILGSGEDNELLGIGGI